MTDSTPQITIAGAGPVGCLLASILSDRGFEVVVFEKRADLRRRSLDGGRSINLVLTDRGLRALDLIDSREAVIQRTVPVLGRMMHDRQGKLAYQPYGRDESECNYSVSRDGLNAFLLDAAEDRGVIVHFDSALRDVDVESQTLEVAGGNGEVRKVDFEVLFGCDGAPSAVRRALVGAGVVSDQVEMMDWGYKEMIFPAGPDDDYAMAGHALHIWPRGHHFLMGLANLDKSFTGTIYMPKEGPDSFESLDSPEKVRAFFERHYQDATALLGDFVDEYLSKPVGNLGTVRCSPWHLDGRVLLLGDASHGIVPFFGQGLNSGFEDCTELVALLEEFEDFSAIFEEFFLRRKPNTDAIADMALENSVEMSEKVGDPDFLLKKKVEALLEKHLGHLYRSRYAMVMYSAIPYQVAFDMGVIQQEILSALTSEITSPEEVDLERAQELIARKLTPYAERHGVVFDRDHRS